MPIKKNPSIVFVCYTYSQQTLLVANLWLVCCANGAATFSWPESSSRIRATLSGSRNFRFGKHTSPSSGWFSRNFVVEPGRSAYLRKSGPATTTLSALPHRPGGYAPACRSFVH
jgi:hypothetical protein